MASQTPREDLPPHSLEEIPPSTAEDAFVDLVRFTAWHSTRAEAMKLLESMDPSKVVHAVQGRTVSDEALSGFELMLGNTLEYCSRRGLLRTPIEAVGIIESVRQGIKSGDIIAFVGEERSPEDKRKFSI